MTQVINSIPIPYAGGMNEQLLQSDWTPFSLTIENGMGVIYAMQGSAAPYTKYIKIKNGSTFEYIEPEEGYGPWKAIGTIEVTGLINHILYCERNTE